MASPETLLKDLSAETLTVEYNTLKEKYDELVKNESQSQQELTQTKLQLEQLKSTAAHSQQEKDAMELKLSDVTNNKQEFTVLINELRQSLAVQRSDNTKLSQDINDYHIKCTKIQIEKEAERHRSEALKIEVDALKLRLNSFGENLEQSRQHFLAADTEIKLINEARRRDRELALSEKSYLEQERDTLSTSIQELRYELTRANTDLHNASDRAKSAEDRCQKMEAAQLTSKKNHNDIIEVYERQRLAAEDQIAKFSAELETAQTKAQAQYTDLVDENKSLKQQLTDAHDRLAVTRNRVDQLIGKCSANGDATAPTTPGTSPSAPLLGGSLLQLVQKYESSGHYWDDIFGDYFKLQDANQRLSKINDELTAVNRRYMREKDNEREYYTRLEAEVDRLRSEQTTHANAVDELAKLKASQQEKFQALEKQIADLSRDKQDLEASLNDTTYQLRYMLRFVQYQYGALPDQVKDTHDLLKDSQIPSSLEHDKTVFKDFDEMQQRNQTLMTDIRHLEANLSQKSTQVDQLSTTLKEKEALLSDASAKSTSLIRDQREKLEAMEHRLSLTVAERDRLLKQAGVNGSMADGEADASPVAVIDTDLQDKLQQSTQKVDELTAEMDAYQQEVELEMAEIRGELKQLQGQTAQLREERNAVQLERDQLKHRNNDLLQVSKSRQNEVEDLRKRESIRDGRIGELENRLMSANNEAMNLTHQLASLRADHSSVSAQLKGYEESYQRLCVENKELANERINLTTLLQNMNENLGSCTSGTAHIVEELKEHNGRLSRELEHLRDRLRTKEKEVRALQGIDQNEWRDKFQQSSGELKQLRVNYLELEKQLATANQDRIMAQTQVSELSRQQQAQPAVTAPTDGASAGEANATTTDGTAAAASSSMEQLVSQLTDANDTVARLKQELFEYKDRLEQADATTNKVSVDFTKFSEDSQARINQLSDDLASNHDKISSLQKQLEELTNEKRDSQTAFNTAELKWQEEKQGLLQEKGTLDDKLKTALDQVANLQSELNQHVTLLKESEQRYQTEVAARTQDAEAMAKLREDVQRLTLDLSSSKAEVLSAQERLGAAELSYRTQKEQTDSSYNDMKLRLDDSQKQQQALSEKIQQLLVKVNELRQSANVAEDAELTELTDSASQQLRDVTSTLRREKDLWQARHTEVQQRAMRAEADLEFVQHQLTTTRAVLDTCRSEKDESSRKQLQHLKDAQNEAVLFKDNNALLRTNLEQTKTRLSELEALLSTKDAQVEPLELKSKGLELELTQAKQMIENLQKKQEAWTARSAMLLTKHNISDPQELEKLKAELETAKAEVEEKVKTIEVKETENKEAVAKLEAELAKQVDVGLQRSRQALLFKKQSEKHEAEYKAAAEEVKKVKEELMQAKKKEAESVSSTAATTRPPEQAQKIEELEAALKKYQEDETTLKNKFSSTLTRARLLAAEKKKVSDASEALRKQNEELTEESKKIKAELEEVKKQLAAKTEELKALEVQVNRMKAVESLNTNKSEKLKKEVASLQAQLKQLSAGPAIAAPTPSVATSASSGPAPTTGTPPATKPLAATPPVTKPVAATPPTVASNKALTPGATTSPAPDAAASSAAATPDTPSSQQVSTPSNAKLSPAAQPFTPTSLPSPNTNGNAVAGQKRTQEGDLEEPPSKK